MNSSRQHWEKVYAEKSPLEVSWYQSRPALSLSLIENCHLDLDEPIIDVGGGASVLVDCLQEQGRCHLAVLDISATSLSVARQRLRERAREVEWFESDITEFIAPHPFSLWHDRAVFHFLTDATDRRSYVSVLKQSLKADGYVIIAAFAPGGPTQCSGLDIVQYDEEKLLAELGDGFELIEQSGELHMTPANKEQLFSYFRLRRC